jgi:hypothetical protein
MSQKREFPTYYGKSLGIIALTAAQFLIGTIHVLFGLWLLTSEITAGSQATIPYDVYTLFFGVLVLLFAGLIWQGKKLGWIGTITISLFVTIADALTLLNLPSIPGIPKGAALLEIAYSVLIVCYLFLPHVRRKFFA